MMEPIVVRARDCACTGTPHGEEGDTVSVLPVPSLACGLAAQADIFAAAGDGSILAQRWLTTYIRHGAVAWNLLDDQGKPLPFDVEAILADYSFALPVANRVDELYSDAVLAPLAARLNGQSQTGQTSASTSPRRQSTRRPRARSSRATLADTKPSTA